MSRTSDDPDGPSPRGLNGTAVYAAGVAPRVLVVDTDRALLGLLEEWLGVCGCVVESDQDRDQATNHNGGVALVIVDVPHPRRGGMELLQRLGEEHPGAPIIALSSTFFSGVESNGGVARALGVACVLPKPVSRESLTTAVRSLLRR